jgi:hypothetical protein
MDVFLKKMYSDHSKAGFTVIPNNWSINAFIT